MKSHEISFIQNIYFIRQNILKICTKHGFDPRSSEPTAIFYLQGRRAVVGMRIAQPRTHLEVGVGGDHYT